MKVKLENQYGTRVVEVKTDGWSWGAFLFGPIWYCFKGLWSKGIGYFLIMSVFFPILTLFSIIAIPYLSGFLLIINVLGFWFFMGAKFNEQYYNYLLDKGYQPLK